MNSISRIGLIALVWLALWLAWPLQGNGIWATAIAGWLTLLLATSGRSSECFT